MRTPHLLLAMALAGGTLTLAACANNDPPRRSVAAQPIGSTATSGPVLGSQGSLDINRDYYIGADPNFPRGTSHGSRGVR